MVPIGLSRFTQKLDESPRGCQTILTPLGRVEELRLNGAEPLATLVRKFPGFELS